MSLSMLFNSQLRDKEIDLLQATCELGVLMIEEYYIQEN